MSENSVAYLETTRSTHICIWAQHSEGLPMSSGRKSYSYSPVTLCGWRKSNYASRARVLYTLLDEKPRYPLCQTCVGTAHVAARLAAQSSPVIEIINNPSEDQTHA